MSKKYYFSCGPSKKYPAWNSDIFNSQWLSRTHIYDFKIFVKEQLDSIRRILQIPSDYEIMFIPASGTGAIWCSFLNLLSPHNTATIATAGYFSHVWAEDLQNQFKLKCNVIEYDQSFIPEAIDKKSDYVFVAVDTSSGIRNLQIPNNMEGLVIADAVSAVFLEDIPWQKLDAISFSAQKILGGDGSLGILALSPKAIERLKTEKPWPIARMFNINRWGLEGVINGQFMSTPSVLALIELSHILNWVETNGGLQFLQQRNAKNWQAMDQFLHNNPQFEYMLKEEKLRGRALACIELKEWNEKQVPNAQRMEQMKLVAQKATELGIYDIANFSSASWRFWLGPMQESEDVSGGLEAFAAAATALCTG